MAMTARVDSLSFAGLKNPYTGEKITVEMVVTGAGAPMFHADPPTYTPDDFVQSREAAIHKWSRKDGVAGARTGQPFVCAYTGRPLRFEERPDGTCAMKGGFNPNMLWTREKFLAQCRARGGKAPGGEPAPMPRAEPAKEKPPVRTREAAEPTDEATKLVETAAKAVGLEHSDTFVSMSVPAKKGGKAGKRG